MDKEELFELLDITSGAEFEYFENFADFAEYDGMVDGDAVYELITDVDMKTFAELAESYFYDILENVPGDQIDLYNLLENIKRVLVGLSEAVRKGEDNAEPRLSGRVQQVPSVVFFRQRGGMPKLVYRRNFVYSGQRCSCRRTPFKTKRRGTGI